MRDLLVHALRYQEREPAVAYAAALAARMHAALTAVHVPPGMPVLPAYDVGTVLVQYAEFLEEELRGAREAEPAFMAWASSLGVVHPRWLVSSGHVANVLQYVGNWHDLLVLGADPADPWGAPAGLAEIVLTSGLPCLVVPAGVQAGQGLCERIVIAWNASSEAIRALHAALPLLQRASAVTLLVGEPKPSDRPLPEFRLGDWLQRHDLAPERVRLDPTQDAGEAILREVAQRGADLVVMGAYGRTRLAEWVLGGVTRHMLRHSPVPVFMRH